MIKLCRITHIVNAFNTKIKHIRLNNIFNNCGVPSCPYPVFKEIYVSLVCAVSYYQNTLCLKMVFDDKFADIIRFL